MNFKAGILAAAAALTLAVPAVALAQPGRDPNFAGSYYDIPRGAPPAPQRPDFGPDFSRPAPVQFRQDDYRPEFYRPDVYRPDGFGYRDEASYRDWRRELAQREWRRQAYLRRLQWERDHSYRGW